MFSLTHGSSRVVAPVVGLLLDLRRAPAGQVLELGKLGLGLRRAGRGGAGTAIW